MAALERDMNELQAASFPEFPGQSNPEARREVRHDLTEIYQQYMELKVRAGNIFKPVVLNNFSRTGIQFESAFPISEGAQTDCLISILRSLSKSVGFCIRIKYCKQKGERFLIGAEIEIIEDSTWFDVFMEVHDYIIPRQGNVY